MSEARDEEQVRSFVEQMAMFLTDWGFPRMPARVLMGLMAADEERLTAGELAKRLAVSPAAISGAVRYLQQLRLITRTSVPGSRSDAYAVPNNAWYTAAIAKGGLYQRLADLSEEGVKALGGDGPAAERITEMRDFFQFLNDEAGQLLERWMQERDRLRAARETA